MLLIVNVPPIFPCVSEYTISLFTPSSLSVAVTVTTDFPRLSGPSVMAVSYVSGLKIGLLSFSSETVIKTFASLWIEEIVYQVI